MQEDHQKKLNKSYLDEFIDSYLEKHKKSDPFKPIDLRLVDRKRLTETAKVLSREVISRVSSMVSKTVEQELVIVMAKFVLTYEGLRESPLHNVKDELEAIKNLIKTLSPKETKE